MMLSSVPIRAAPLPGALRADVPRAVADLRERGEADGAIARFLRDPSGRVAGLWLADGTVIEASPSIASATSERMHVGDRVHLRYGPAGTLGIDDLDRGTHVDVGPLTLARGGGPNSSGGTAPPDPSIRGLVMRTEGAPLRQIGFDLGGRTRTMLLASGVQVFLPPRVADVALAVPIGTPLVVHGYAAPGNGDSIVASRIARSDGQVVFDRDAAR
jgi:hypothetical protein